MRPGLAVPNEDFAIPVVVVVMPRSRSVPDIAEYVVAVIVAVVPVHPISATPLFWDSKGIPDVGACVFTSNVVHRLTRLTVGASSGGRSPSVVM